MKRIKLSELGEIVGGSTPSTKDITNYDGEISWITPKDLANHNNIFIENGERSITIKGFNSCSVKMLPKNSILFTSRAPIGYIAIAKKELCTNQGFKSIIPNDKIYYLFLYYLLKYNKDYIASFGSGTTFKEISGKVMKNIEIVIPDRLEIQKKIAYILFNIDKKIELNNQINDNLHDLAEQLFFEIYKNGRERTLGDLLENISTGARPKGGAQKSGIPSVGAEKIEKFGIYDYSSEKYIAEDFYEKLKNGKMNSEDVLLYKDGAYTGKVSMCLNWFPHKKSAVNEHVFILNTENNWAQNYLYFTLYNKQNKEMLERLAGAKAAQPGLNQTELKSLKINICNKEFIKKFENEVKPIMESIANNSLENKKLVELRDTLLPKLMNGEINLDKIEI